MGEATEMAKHTSVVSAPPAKTKEKSPTPTEKMLLNELIHDEGIDAPLHKELLIKYGLHPQNVLSWVEEILLGQ